MFLVNDVGMNDDSCEQSRDTYTHISNGKFECKNNKNNKIPFFGPHEK